jgi:DNA-binding MarR family transcriptional regulator
MGALTDQVALTSGGVTRLLDRMIKAGYVERRQCPTDRRVVYAALTSAGRRKIDEAAQVHARDLEEVFASFSPQERRVLDGLLDRLRPGRSAAVHP